MSDNATLAKIDQMRQWLAEATTVNEIKQFMDLAEQARLYARQKQMGLETQNYAAELHIDAAREMGAVLARLERPDVTAIGGPGRGRKNVCNVAHVFSEYATVLEETHTTRFDANRYEKLAALPVEVYAEQKETIIDRQKELTLAAMLRATKEPYEKGARVSQAGPLPATIELTTWDTWLPQQDDCDLLLTDPPYMTDVPDIAAFAAAWMPTALSKVKPTGRAYVCIGAYPQELRAYLNVPTPLHLVQANVLVWTYRNTLGPAPAYDYKQNWQAILYYHGTAASPLACPIMLEQFTVQDIAAPDGRQSNRLHTWQKPDELARRLITHSTQPGQTILDPFAGTGTFLVVASQLGRLAYGCDNDPLMIDLAVSRGCYHA